MLLRAFYAVLGAISGICLAVQLIVYIFFGVRLFKDQGELFEKKNDRIEWQTVFPKNMTRLIIFIFVFSVTGLLLDAFGAEGWLSMPCAAVGGITFNFLLNTVIAPLYFRLTKNGEPDDSSLEGAEAVAEEEITPEGYGAIRVRNGCRSYYYNAVSANGNIIEEGEKVIIIMCEDKMCLVESERRFFDVLFENEKPLNIDINLITGAGYLKKDEISDNPKGIGINPLEKNKKE